VDLRKIETSTGEIVDEEMVDTVYEQMLQTRGYSKLLNLFLQCAEQTKKTFPELTAGCIRYYHALYDAQDDIKGN